MKKKKIILLLLSIAFLFLAFLYQTNFAYSTPGTSEYKRPLCEYEDNGVTKYCCKDTQNSSCSASVKCSDIVD